MINPRINWALLLIIIALIILALSLAVIDYKVKVSMVEIARSKVQVEGVKTINKIVNERIVAEVEYRDIVCVHKDDKGRVVLIQPNTIVLNQMMAATIEEVSSSIIDAQENMISIPLGQITGSDILAGYGPKIKIKIIPTGEVHVKVLDKFEQAGINQTRHLIYLQVENRLKVAVPLINDDVKVRATIPLAETIIVGDVPQTYVDFKGESEMIYPFINGR